MTSFCSELNKFRKKANFPLVLFLPSMVVTYTLPSKVPQNWNYKKFFSFNLMAAALPDRYFSYIFGGFLSVYIIALYLKIHNYFVN
jgi:hypothetical protein